VYLMDFDLNYAALSSKIVSVSLTTESVTTPGLSPALYGFTSVAGRHGSGRFDDLKVTVAGRYRLDFSLGSFHVQSVSFSVKAGEAAIMFVHQQPCAIPCRTVDNFHQVAADLFETSVSVRDAYYNLIFFQDAMAYYDVNASVSLRRYPAKPNVGALLEGTLSVPPSPQEQGLFGYSFTDISIKEQGFYAIVFEVYFRYTITNATLVFDVQVCDRKVQVSEMDYDVANELRALAFVPVLVPASGMRMSVLFGVLNAPTCSCRWNTFK